MGYSIPQFDYWQSPLWLTPTNTESVQRGRPQNQNKREEPKQSTTTCLSNKGQALHQEKMIRVHIQIESHPWRRRNWDLDPIDLLFFKKFKIKKKRKGPMQLGPIESRRYKFYYLSFKGRWKYFLGGGGGVGMGQGGKKKKGNKKSHKNKCT